MPIKQQIPKKLNLKAGENFKFLREEGIKLIQRLSGKKWTDHNAHDPGITLLEAFCYNLTDLSIRANQSIEDLIASSLPISSDGLFAPEEILYSGPLTINDFRKLLIDLDGVKNGWLLPIQPNKANDAGGLYDVLIELDENGELGDLNSSIIIREFHIDYGGGDIRTYQAEFSFPYWDEQDVSPFRTDVTINTITGPLAQPILLVPTDPEDENDFFAGLEITYNAVETFSFAMTIRVRQSIGNDPVENLAVETEIIGIISEVLGGGPDDQSLMKVFNRKVTAAFDVRDTVSEMLMDNRNLSEDFRDIKAVRIQEIALQVQIDVLSDINIETYLANFMFLLEEYFSPGVPFVSFYELQKKGLSIEEIFLGPALSNGFINDASLYGYRDDQSDLNVQIIYVSDLTKLMIQASLDLLGINQTDIKNQPLAVQRFSISNYMRNRIVTANAVDCLALAKPELFKPRFSFTKSQFVFLRNDVEIPFNEDLVFAIYNELKHLAVSESPITQPLPFPKGTKLPVSEFYSIQHDLPALYGLGRNVLSDTFSNVRKSSSEQLRAYLVAVDHLLASYNNQLYHLNELFSYSKNVKNTYYPRPLYSIPYLERLLVGYLNGTLDWENYQNDLNNSYQLRLAEMFESRDVFIDRRNRFLNHILARYGVSFADYSAYRRMEESGISIEPDELSVRTLEIAYDLLFDKIHFLQNYPLLSSERFSSYDYTETAWNTINSGPFIKRILSLLGVQNLGRRTLNSEEANFIQTNSVGPNWTFTILNGDGLPILESESDYPTGPDAVTAGRTAIIRGAKRSSYLIEAQAVGTDIQFLPRLLENDDQPPVFLANRSDFIEEEWDARVWIRRTIKEIREIGSGMHVVEHVLLRPEQNTAGQLDLIIPEKDSSEPVVNPYAFRVSCILPSGFSRDFSTTAEPNPEIPSHFGDPAFRDYAGKILREETPAHIIPHIFWLDRNTVPALPDTPSLENFEQRWQNWLVAKADTTTPPGILISLRNELIVVLNAIFDSILIS